MGNRSTLMRTIVLTMTLLCACAGILTAQRQAPAATRHTFDAVTIRRNLTNDVGSNIMDRANGFTMLNVPVSALVARAYSPTVPLDMVGLPRWATSDRYDVTASSSLAAPTQEQRTEMLRNLLADRFKLTAHVEQKPTPAYDLVLLHADRKLGPGIQTSTIDCESPAATKPAPATSDPKLSAQVPAATARVVRCMMAGDGDRIEGDTTLPALADMFVPVVGRPVVDKTGLKGSYHVVMTYAGASRVRRTDAASTTPAPLIFDAVQDQLGMKLQSSTTLRQTLVIDRLERPSDN